MGLAQKGLTKRRNTENEEKQEYGYGEENDGRKRKRLYEHNFTSRFFDGVQRFFVLEIYDIMFYVLSEEETKKRSREHGWRDAKGKQDCWDLTLLWHSCNVVVRVRVCVCVCVCTFVAHQ